MHRYCVAIAMVTFTVNGVGAGGWHRSSYGWSSAYCYPAYSYSYPPTYVYPAVMPLATMPLAVPTPAPPSQQTVEPPLQRKAFMPSAEKAIARPGVVSDRCRVGFWNQSGRDVTLLVAGQMHLVPHDRAVTLDVPRTFIWQLDHQAARTEKIGEERATYDIVLR